MAGAKGVIGSMPGTHRVRAHTMRTKTGFTSVRQHTAVNAVQTGERTVRTPGLKHYMAHKASIRSGLIRATREKALLKRY